nr:MAG TPA: hypothetical protein [Caudoviricetes sp.]
MIICSCKAAFSISVVFFSSESHFYLPLFLSFTIIFYHARACMSISKLKIFNGNFKKFLSQ